MLLVWKEIEGLMGRGSELVSWLTWGFVIPCELIPSGLNRVSRFEPELRHL